MSAVTIILKDPETNAWVRWNPKRPQGSNPPLGVYDRGKRRELVTYDATQDLFVQGTHWLVTFIRPPGELPNKNNVVSARVRPDGNRVIVTWVPEDGCKPIRLSHAPETKVGW